MMSNLETLVFPNPGGSDLRLVVVQEFVFEGRDYSALIEEAHLDEIALAVTQGRKPEVVLVFAERIGENYQPVGDLVFLESLSKHLEASILGIATRISRMS